MDLLTFQKATKTIDFIKPNDSNDPLGVVPQL